MPPLPIASRNPVISTTSILILSGFLVLAPLTDLAEQELSPFVMGTGLVGLLSYVALQVAAERRAFQDRVADQVAAHRRLNKHLTAPILPPISLNFGSDPLAELFSDIAATAPKRRKQSAHVG